MNPDEYHVSTSGDRTRAHVDPHCNQLGQAAEFKTVDREEAEELGLCYYCRPTFFDREVTLPAPKRVECPCGTGYAERKQPIFEPLRSAERRKPSIQWNYRHTGCWIGGTIVVANGEVHHRTGPLFDPVRFGIDRAFDMRTGDSTGEVFAD